MSTPTEILEDLKTAFAALYSAPVFGDVEDGEETGDKYLSATVATEYTLRVDYRVSGNETWTNSWTVTLTGPTSNPNLPDDPNAYLIRQLADEDATDADILEILTDYITLLQAIAAGFEAVP